MSARVEQLFRVHQNDIYRRTDRMFAVLMVLQYFAGIVAALLISPKTWSGAQSSVHIHVWSAVLLGAVILSLPIGLAILMPGRALTRHVIAVGQMLDSALLIHLTGGRIETHFHVFGSLAFLGFYRDWRVLVSASMVVAVDHFLRGVYWPQSVFGVLSPSPFRWIEHAAWVLFEDIFLTLACYQSIREMRQIAEKQAHVEQAAQALKEALESKNEFISVCGHELKTPLTSLSLQAQRMRRAMQGGKNELSSDERVLKLSDQTHTQVRRLLRLIEDMLDHSRIQMGKLSVYPEEVDLKELVRSVTETYRAQMEADACIIQFEAQDEVRGVWDRLRIEQVVTNLISNAIKYGLSKPIEVIVKDGGAHALIIVKDHGMGIEEAHQSRVFQQFERVSTSSHISGLGLGLYISKSIVERHSGRLLLESALGRGTTFTVELPYRPSFYTDSVSLVSDRTR